MKLKIGFLSLLVATLLLAACSGGGGSTPDPTTTPTTPTDPTPEVTASTGVLLDSPVAGIQYRTATKSGKTNANGEYEYVAGETVVFFIGGLEFPPVKASGVVTPVDIAAGNETLQTNILQVLQTLDSDGNPDNGITIYEEAAEAFAEAELDLTSTGFDDDVASVLNTIGEGIALVSETDAKDHFKKTMKNQILGSWDITEEDGNRNVLTFIDETRYIVIHEVEELEEKQLAGSVEYGTYTWDTTTGAFEVFVINDGDGYGGLWDEYSHWTTATVQDNTLILHLTDGDDNEDFDVTLTRIQNPVDSLVGAYVFEETETDNVHALTFLSETEYVIAHRQVADGDDPEVLAGEFGTYTYNMASKAFNVTSATVDADGEGGLYNATAPEDQENESMFITASGSLVFSADTDEDPVYFQRISSTLSPSYSQSDLTGTWYSVGTVTPNEKGEIENNSWADAGTMTVEPNGDYEWITKDADAETETETGTLAFLDPEKGTLTSSSSDDDSDETLGWYMNAGKDVMTLVFNNSVINEQGTITFVKAADSYTPSDFNGSWYCVGVGTPNQEGDASNYWTETGTVVFNGDHGAYTWTINDPEDDGETGTLSFSEAGVIDDGNNENTDNDLLGWYMNAHKDVMTLLFDDTSDNEQGTFLFVKAADAYEQTDLAGVWHSVCAATPTADGSIDSNSWAEAGTVIIDASGKYISTNNLDEDSVSGTLSISAEGAITNVEENVEETDILGWYLNAGKDVMTMVFDGSLDDSGALEQGIITFVKQK